MMQHSRGHAETQDAPLRCREALEEALEAPELDEFDAPCEVSDAAKEAALEVAVALGKCRIFGVNLNELDGSLPIPIAVAAAEALTAKIREWMQQADELSRRWDEAVAVEPVEAEELCIGTVERLMDSWAATVAIEEALAPEYGATTTYPALDHLIDAWSTYSDRLQQADVLPLLATAADTNLLANWRNHLAPRWQEVPPWWLDGTLEAVAEESWQRMLAELPSPRAIASQASRARLVQRYQEALHAPLRIAAAADATHPRTVVRWDAPDGQWTAYLMLPPQPAAAQEAETLSLAFYTPEGDPARALAGRPVRLDGVASEIDARGVASLRRDALAAAASQDLRLEVDPAWEVWTLSPQRRAMPVGSWEQVLAYLRCDPRTLKPGQLFEVVRQMRSLADWWLGEEARQRLEERCGVRLAEPKLPTAAGTSAILLAQRQPPPWPVLRPAFLLPVQWRKGEATSRRLPPCLQELAQSVANTLQLPHWGLHLSERAGLDQIDLSDLDDILQFQSGWATLAGSLMVTAEGGQTTPDVWATGAWEPHGGIRPIDDLPAKVALAIEWKVRQLFVPQQQVSQAQELVRAAAAELEIGALYEGRADPQEALADYRDALELPPLATAPRDERRSYYLRCKSEQRARDYYRTHLLPEIARDLKQQWDAAAGAAVTHLVTIVSDNPEAACLTLAAVRPQHALILWTSDKQGQRAQIEQLLNDSALAGLVAGSRCTFLECPSSDALVAQLPEAVKGFVHGAEPEAIVLDLTPGTKEMSLTLALEIAQPGNRMCYLRHQRQGPRVIPFSENLRVFSRT